MDSTFTGCSIYSDETAEVLKRICEVEVFRASHVETVLDLPEETVNRLKKEGRALDTSLWWVDFSPIQDTTLLGPFESRENALKAERDYLASKLYYS